MTIVDQLNIPNLHAGQGGRTIPGYPLWNSHCAGTILPFTGGILKGEKTNVGGRYYSANQPHRRF